MCSFAGAFHAGVMWFYSSFLQHRRQRGKVCEGHRLERSECLFIFTERWWRLNGQHCFTAAAVRVCEHVRHHHVVSASMFVCIDFFSRAVTMTTVVVLKAYAL